MRYTSITHLAVPLLELLCVLPPEGLVGVHGRPVQVPAQHFLPVLIKGRQLHDRVTQAVTQILQGSG